MTLLRKAPVFVVGCHRSGTSFLYHCLLSAGGFAVYRADTGVWDRLIPLFGDLRRQKNRERMMKAWLRSKLFERTGLSAAQAKQIETKVLADCRNGGDFLTIVMEETARNQKVDRWAAWNPDNTFYIREIKKEIPDALFIHIIRDGRDVATNLNNKGWIRPFPWDRKRSLLVAGVFWDWMVEKGRKHGEAVKPRYMEVRYEGLVARPHETLAKLGAFIDHDLDYDRIQRRGIGTVADPNSTFGTELTQGQFNPIGRWNKKLSPEEIICLEGVIGGRLKELDYPLTTPNDYRCNHFGHKMLRALYLSFFESKLWLKSNTPLGRFASTEPLGLVEQRP